MTQITYLVSLQTSDIFLCFQILIISVFYLRIIYIFDLLMFRNIYHKIVTCLANKKCKFNFKLKLIKHNLKYGKPTIVFTTYH